MYVAPVYIVCADLSGPAGMANTGIAVFAAGDGALNFVDQHCDGSDASIYSMVKALSRESSVIVGLDAPLSYEPGGGQRVRDAMLRREIVQRGLRPGSVMAPTAPRMVYLTLRGIALAQVLSALQTENQVNVVEVHPGASLSFRDAPLDAILAFSTDEMAREVLLEWFPSLKMQGIRPPTPCSSHFVAACAGAVAAWDWHYGRSRWLARAEHPWHPYDFAV
jgi:uncharacterized protein